MTISDQEDRNMGYLITHKQILTTTRVEARKIFSSSGILNKYQSFCKENIVKK